MDTTVEMIPNEIPTWLQRERTARNWSQAEVAARIGVSQGTISSWERGKFTPDDVQIVRLHAIFEDGAQLQPEPFIPAPVEGADTTTAAGWGDEYPLDAVFVRTDQRTASEVVKRIRQGRYDLNPDFQRDFVWDIVKRSRLIESCTMRIPLPVFYVAEAPDGKIIVVDGLQRLSTFNQFLNNEFKLGFPKSEDVPPHPLEGKYFKDLDLKLQERIEDTQLTLYILDSKAPERAKLDIFERVNNGEPLTRQQMRNCLYNGPATIWLKEASLTPIFLEATGQSLDAKRMRDREAINRFCAFSIIGWQQYKSGDMDTYLADALERMNKMNDYERQALRAGLERSLRVNFSLFGRHAFRKSLTGESGGDRSVLNIALFDVCSVILAKAEERAVQARATALKDAVKKLLASDDFNHAITYSTNSRKQVHKRFSDMEQTVNGAIL
jgi:transcriptional regulator with XRE-family HTH domain